MNKKVITIVAVLLVAVLGFAGYRTFLAPQGVEGAKEVTIEIVVEDENIDESFTYDTDHEFLYDLMVEHQEELGASFEEYDFGVMTAGLMDYTANQSNNEYFHLLVNGVDAVTGPAEVVLNDQDLYQFELRTY